MISFEPIARLEEILNKISGIDEYHLDELTNLEPEAYLKVEEIVFAVLEDGDNELVWDMLKAASSKEEITDNLNFCTLDDCQMLFYYAIDFLVVFVQQTEIDYAESILNSFYDCI